MIKVLVVVMQYHSFITNSRNISISLSVVSPLIRVVGKPLNLFTSLLLVNHFMSQLSLLTLRQLVTVQLYLFKFH